MTTPSVLVPLHCPFCGGEANEECHYTENTGVIYKYGCRECEYTIGSWRTRMEDAVSDWNTRMIATAKEDNMDEELSKPELKLMQEVAYWKAIAEAKEPVAAKEDTQTDPDFPNGAIFNGKSFADQLVTNYQFKEVSGHELVNCYEWQQLMMCFDYMAEYLKGMEK